MAGTNWGRALLGAAIAAMCVARWLPAAARDVAPWATVALGAVGLALIVRSPGRRRWSAPLLILAAPVLLVALGVIWPVADAPLPARLPARVALANVRVVDVAAGRAGPATDIVIEDGAIRAIGTAPPGLARIEGGGAYVVPGFWDMHVHSFQTTPQLAHALMLAHGITHVRDMMDCPAPPDPLVACIADKRSWSSAAARGARAGPVYAGMASFYFESPELTAAAVRDRARAYAARGADALKAYNLLSRDAYFALADEARRLGLPVVGHLPRAVPLESAIAAGQRSFEHARILVDACGGRASPGASPTDRIRAVLAGFDPARCDRLMRAMARHGAALVPTHVTREEDARASAGFDPGLDWLDPLSAWAWRDDQAATAAAYPGPDGAALLEAYHRRGLSLTGAAHARGVTILVGTDTVPAGPRYHDELAMLARAGLSPAAVLRAASLDAARFAGRSGRFGTVAPGKAADLVLLGRDPTRDIGATRQRRGLVFAGRFYGPADLAALERFTRRQARHPANMAKLLWGFLVSPAAAEL